MDYAPTDYDFGTPANYSFAMEITCANDEARAMFVEAFGHMLNYNHEQAIACFSKVTELDETCAMAWWGIAYCVSSNYNWAPGLGSGHDSIQKAVTLKEGCTELEQDLMREKELNDPDLALIMYRVDPNDPCPVSYTHLTLPTTERV